MKKGGNPKKKMSKITVPKKKTKEEEKPKEVEPPKRARRKFIGGPEDTGIEDRKIYRDYKRIKCDKMNSISFIINQFQMKGNFEEAKDKINTMKEMMTCLIHQRFTVNLSNQSQK